MASLPNIPIEVAAKLDTTARGSDSGALIVSVTGLLLFVAACGASILGAAAPLVYGGGLTGLGLTVLGGRGWWKGRRQRELAEAPPTEIYLGETTVFVKSNRVSSNRELQRLLIGAMQGRRSPPEPYGSAGATLRPYSEDEKRRFVEEQRQREAAHDQQLLEELRRRVLPGAAGPPTSAGERSQPKIAGISQDPDPDREAR
jgi:hypothetical protein